MRARERGNVCKGQVWGCVCGFMCVVVCLFFACVLVFVCVCVCALRV